MLKKILTNKVSLSLIIVALILIGTVVSPLQGIVSNSAPTVEIIGDNYTRKNNDKVLPELASSGNLLYGRPYLKVTQMSDGTDTSASAIYDLKGKANTILTDGNVYTGTYFSAAKFFDGEKNPINPGPTYDDPKSYTDVSFSFAGKATVNEVWIYHHDNIYDSNDKSLVTRVFQIYLSDSEETLFTSASLVATHENTALDKMHKIKFSTPYENKKYIGVRYLVPTASTADGAPRLYDLAAYGTLNTDEPTVTEGHFGKTDVINELKSDSNLIYNREFKKLVQQNGDSVITNAFPTKYQKTAFTDTDLLHNDINNRQVYFDDSCNPTNTSPYLAPRHYTDIVYDFADNADISEIWVYNINSDSIKYVTYAYQLFLSYSEDKLFHAESLVATYENTNKKGYQKFKFDKPLKNKGYFAIRILMSVDPSTPNTNADVPRNSRNVRLAELAVFGELKPETVKVTEDNYTGAQEDADINGSDNLILGREYNSIIQFTDGKDTSNTPITDIKNNKTGYTNGNTTSNVPLYGKIYYNEDGTPKNTEPYTDVKNYTSVTYFLGGKSTVDEVWVYNCGTSTLTTHVYEIYLAQNRDDLYKAESLVHRYTNNENKTRQKFKLKTPVTAAYFGIKVLVATPDNTTSGAYVRLTQLAVFGTLEEAGEEDKSDLYKVLSESATSNIISDTYNQLEEDTEITAEKGNLVFGKKYNYIFQLTNGKDTSIGAAAKIIEKPTAYTNGNTTGNVQLDGQIYYDDEGNPKNNAPYGETDNYTAVAYFLGGKSTVNEVWVYNCIQPVLTTHVYQIYLADTREDLYKSESLVETYVNEHNKPRQKFKFKTPQSGTYIGIKILLATPSDTGEYKISSRYARLTQLAVFGTVDVPCEEDTSDLYKVVTESATSTITADSYTKSELDTEITAEKGNLIFGREYNSIIQLTNGKNTSKGAAAKISEKKTAYTNGNTKGNVQLDGQIYYEADGSAKNEPPYKEPRNYTAVTYFLGGKSTVNEVWVYNCSIPELTTHVYQIYLSDSREKLYEPKSLVETYTNEHNKLRQKFKFKTAQSGTYIGIKILVATPKDIGTYADSNRYARLTQLAVFGTVNKATTEDKSDLVIKEYNDAPKQENLFKQLYSKYKRNLIKGYVPKMYFNEGTGEQVVTNAQNVDKLTDESSENGFYCGQPRFAELVGDDVITYKDGSQRYFKMSFNMRTSCKVSHILFVNSSGEDFRTFDYEVYLSNDLDSLFSPSNMKKHYVNSGLEQINNITFDKAVTAQYVGIKINYPTSENLEPKRLEDGKIENNVYTRINEIAVFGDYSDPDFEFPPSYAIDPNMTSKQLKTLGTSLIANKMPNCRFDGTPLSVGFYGQKEAQFTDGIIETHVDVTSPATATYKLTTTDGSSHLDIIYDWSEVKYDISGFLFAGMPPKYSTSIQFYIGWYQVYIAEDYDDLFLPENMAFEYKWDGDTYERGHYVNFPSAKRGAYFAVRILNPVSGATTNIAPRIAEIAVYGEKANIIVKPTNLAANMPVEAYTQNDDGSLDEVTSQQLTAKEIKKMTDGDKSTSASIKTDKTVQLIYNLCNDSVIDIFGITSNAKKCKVYAAIDLNDIWSEDALVYTYKGKGKNEKSLKEGIKVRYVRFELSDFDDTLTIKEVNCIGGDDQLLKYKKLSRTFKGEQVTLSSYDTTTSTQKLILTQFNGYMATLFDSGYTTPLGIWGGKHNEVYVDMIITLDDVRNIDTIAISFPKILPGYSPTKFEIYTSEVLSEFDDGEFDLEPIVSYDGEAVLGTYKTTFTPRLARSILVRFISGVTDYDPYLNGQMTFGITEFEVYGTPVKGMQKDTKNPTLVGFKDKKTGISLEVLKYDDNDIYTDAYKLKVEKIPATLEQKKSLASQGALKIIDDTVYKVTLLDLAGNQLTEAGGREIKISLPCDVEKYGYPLLAQATKDGVVALDGLSETTNHYFTTTDITDGYYIVAAFTSSDDPYFDGLDVEIPDEPTIPDLDYDYTDTPPTDEDTSDIITDTELDDSADIEPDDEIIQDNLDIGTESPTTGETLPTLAIAILLIALAVCYALKKETN